MTRRTTAALSKAVTSDPRYRRAAGTASAALGARIISLVLTLLTVPLSLGLLGTERYGAWVAISAIVALLGFTDLGVGNGVLNAVTRSLAAHKPAQARREISSAVILLGAIVLVIGFVLAGSAPLVAWERLIGVNGVIRDEARSALAIAFTCFLAGLPVSIASQVRHARQEGWTVHVAAAIGNVAAIGALLLVTTTGGGLPQLAIAMSVPPLLAAIANSVVLFRRDAPELAPTLQLADAATGRRMLRAGFFFFVLQSSMVVAFSSDAIVVAQLIGPDAVAQYGVASRLFAIPLGAIALVLAPLWPAYGQAIAQGDMAWVHQTIRRTVTAAAVVTTIAAATLVVVAPWLVRLWVGGAVELPGALILGFGAWIAMSAVGTAVAMFLNGAGEIRLQAFFAVCMAAANITLSIALTARFGVAGVIWGTVVSYAGLTLLPMAYYAPRVLSALNHRAQMQAESKALQA